ncbi:MAG: zinc-dependent metalloprotease [Saprospiraceae bacterium]
MFKNTWTRLLLLCFVSTLLSVQLTFAQGAKPPVKNDADKTEEGDKKEDKKKEKTFTDFVTDKAKSMEGMFNVHEVEGKYYFEIPDAMFGRDILAVTRIAKAPTGAGYGGEQANEQVIRFEKGPKKNVFMRVISYVNVTPDTLQPLYTAIENSNVQPIAQAFPISATRKDTSVLIEVTKFFEGDNSLITLPSTSKQRYKIRAIQKDRSFIKKIAAYPINIEVNSVKTFSVSPPSINPSPPGRRPRTTDLIAGRNTGVITLEMNTSMVLLPEVPMKRRLFDPRVGIFANGYTVFDEDNQRAKPELFTVRWRLEAKNAADAAAQQRGELIEPKKPIVYYIDPATPEKWVSYLKQGVEDWQPAFEQAGWKNAIQAKDWPVNDTTMSLNDSRYSVIRYFASSVQNAYGPNVHDPRSGEILESHIGWYHNIQRLLKNWYTIQTAMVDTRAQKNELDEELMGSLIRFVSAHEVGHTIGLHHNFGASHGTPVEKLRDADYLRQYGHTSSIMDYARFNYVAQPEDNIPAELLFPGVGDYDKWAIEWNYKPIYNTADEYEDKKILNQWYKEKAAGDPRLAYITQVSPYDPRAQSEDLGDNAVLASQYGIKNLKRIVPNLLEWTAEDANGYDMANELYNSLVGQYRRYIGHVSKWVGGVYETPKTYDEEGRVYEPASKARQKEAMNFLNQQLFQTPDWMIDEELLGRVRPDAGVAAIGNIQQSAINSLLSVSRMQRMIENKAGDPNNYGIQEMHEDLHKSIWTELKTGQAVDLHRRNLQKMHLEKLISNLEPKAGFSFSFSSRGLKVVNGPSMDPMKTDIVSITRGNLMELHEQLEKGAKKASDKLTKYHYQDALNRIERALELDD